MYIISNNTVNNQEEKGRGVFLSIFSGMTWTQNQDKFGVWDASGSTKTTDMYCEVKSRAIKSNEFYTTFLEVKKYNHLMNLADLSPTGKAFYFVTFTDGVSYLYDLKKIENIEIFRDQRLMKEVTLEGQTKMVMKDIYAIPLYAKMPGVIKYKS